MWKYVNKVVITIGENKAEKFTFTKINIKILYFCSKNDYFKSIRGNRGVLFAEQN